MTTYTHQWTLHLDEEYGHRDLTEKVGDVVSESGITFGTATVAVTGSTCAVTSIEYESGALQDLRRALDQLAPANLDYAHNARYGDGNGFSHVRSALLKTSIAIPVIDGKLHVGTWQRVMVINLDNRPRDREIVVVVTGD